MIPARLLPHQVTVTTPVTVTNPYGNEDLDYDGGTVRTVQADVQPQTGDEETVDRNAVSRRYLMFTNEPVAALDRVTFDGRVYNVDGPSEDWTAPAGAHHHETRLTRTDG